MSPEAHARWDFVADLVNPLLGVLLIVALVLQSRRQPPFRWSFLGRVLLSVLIVYLLAHLDRRLDLWPRFGLDYSAHSALAVSLTTSIAFLQRRWLVFLVPLLVAYAVLMVILGFHSWLDIITTVAIVAPLAWLCHVAFHNRRKSETAPSLKNST